MKCIIWNLALVQLDIVLASVQDRCVVCSQCTIGSETVVEVPDSISFGEEAQVKARFGLFRDSANLDER